MRHFAHFALALLAALALTTTAHAQAPEDDPGHLHASRVSDEALSTMEWRNIGPARGGRAHAAAGVIGDRFTYYMGATGGGVFKTTDAGASWKNVTDGFVGTGSVGAIAVAPSDPNVVYVGMGEAAIRGNFSHGDGVYRSDDAGETWTHVGLEDTRQIGRIVVHPTDPNTVFVAALGHIFGPNAQRGVFKSTDGGKTWRKVLYVNDRTGAMDIAMDPNNPRHLFAAFWQVRRTPWSLESGGPGSGLWRSQDGGETWTKLSGGLPKGVKGKIGVTVSRAQKGRVWAIVEAEDGGVFRSDDGGDSWRRVNKERKLRQRAWYYTRIYADTQDPDTVYVLNVRFWKSTDGGETFESIRVPHGDNHDLWIDPHDNQRMLEVNDGGANVSFDGGRTWSTQANQPTAQFYHVTTDTRFPYRVYGAQQDNSTASVSSQLSARSDWKYDLYAVGGGESGYIAVRPDNPDIVFAGSYGGYMTRYDHSTGKTRNIQIWPDNPMGGGVVHMEYRFQWTFPIVLSPHDPDILYVGANVLFKSTDEGATWTQISPDLTTDDPTKQQSSGGPITQDNTGVEYYCTIFTVAESPLESGLIWVGSDDGLVHITENGGDDWKEVTPPGMGDWPLISLVEPSPHDPDTAYLAVNRYKMDDFRPYIYKTTDRGASWELIVDGIDDGAFVRSVREDPVRPGLLYAGTETGVWVSLDDGDSWRSLQRNLPVTPVTDLVVKNADLVVATQGRSFWILDDVTPLRQMTEEILDSDAHLFAPDLTYREGWDSVTLHYMLAEKPEQAKIEILDDDGDVLRTFTTKSEDGEKEEYDADEDWFGAGPPGDDTLNANAGMNALTWNMRGPDPIEVPGAVGWPPMPPGVRVGPGTYTARLTVGERTLETPFEIAEDPRIETSTAEYAEQIAFLEEIHDALNRAHRAVNTIRGVRSQVMGEVKHARHSDSYDEIREEARKLDELLTDIEEHIIQTKSKSPQDPLNYPIRLNDKIGYLHYVVENDYPPTAQARKVLDSLTRQLDKQLVRLEAALERDVPEFNELVRTADVPAVVLPPEGEGS